MEVKTTGDRSKSGIVALAGNPNVGKSTLFNALTGLNQHTGNWPGKTVSIAQGYCKYMGREFVLVDLPGCYSLSAHSADEEIARDFICFDKPDAVIVVCDAVCLERNLNLVIQILEITSEVILCVNLMDEARKKGIEVDLCLISKILGVPVVGTAARNKEGLADLMDAIGLNHHPIEPYRVNYPLYIRNAVSELSPLAEAIHDINPEWIALKLLEDDKSLLLSAKQHYGAYIETDELKDKLSGIKDRWALNHITPQQVKDDIALTLVKSAEAIGQKAVIFQNKTYDRGDRFLDKILTSKLTGFPVMLLVLLAVFWITVVGANYPSELIAGGLFWLGDRLLEFFAWLNIPDFITGIVLFGVYRVLAWVVSVMLPPMAIFFPLFTLLEDSGYLPRVAFNLDKVFKKCSACGKQALTMCMGFGCNAAGVIGCRIIDSPRERLIAIITNNFVPCNGRFPPPRLE